MRYLFLLPFFLLPLLLTACTSYEESFDCPPGCGVGCVPITRVNQMVEEGALPLDQKPQAAPPFEVPQKSLNLWMAPHEDESGISYGAHRIHVPLEAP